MMKFIRRSPDSPAWRVRIRRGTFEACKYFPDEHHGGREQALAAAKAYRDAQEKYSRKFLKEAGGLSLQKYGKRHVYAVAIIIKGERHYTSFGLIKHGEEGAKQMAETWLKKKRLEKKRVEGNERFLKTRKTPASVLGYDRTRKQSTG